MDIVVLNVYNLILKFSKGLLIVPSTVRNLAECTVGESGFGIGIE